MFEDIEEDLREIVRRHDEDHIRAVTQRNEGFRRMLQGWKEADGRVCFVVHLKRGAP